MNSSSTNEAKISYETIRKLLPEDKVYSEILKLVIGDNEYAI